MTISSRTPEGWQNHCPVCQSEVRIEPSLPWGDAPCPSCGTLLWFVRGDRAAHIAAGSRAEEQRRRLRELIAEHHGVVPDELAESPDWSALDSLEVVEIAMELETEGR